MSTTNEYLNYLYLKKVIIGERKMSIFLHYVNAQNIIWQKHNKLQLKVKFKFEQKLH